MNPNEALQWTIVALLIILALIWATCRILNIGKKKSNGRCNCTLCNESTDCKAKEIKEHLNKKDGMVKTAPKNCRDGQSAKN